MEGMSFHAGSWDVNVYIYLHCKIMWVFKNMLLGVIFDF